MRSMSRKSGLVSYGGDSEISDSEDEGRISMSISPTESKTVALLTNNLGIPQSQPRVPSPPLPKPVVQAAPVTSLVDYIDEDHHDISVPEEVFYVHTANVVEGGKNDGNGIPLEVKYAVPLFLQTCDIILPPEPSIACSKRLQNKILDLLEKAGSGIDLNSSLQERKDLRNPSIYEKLVHYCDLDEFGTNYPEDLYNPKEWTEESYYDNLFKEQKKEYTKKEKAKLDRTTVEFVTGTKRQLPANSKSEPVKRQRRTKWDIATSSSGPESGGSRGSSPSSGRPPLLGNAPIGMQPRVLQSGVVGAQAKAQASQLSKELSKAK